jgi:uncharacterized protein YeaO (DUF488 family)
MKVHVKRVYEAPDPGDGQRILIDRLWPRGLSKAKAKIDLWLKAIAPSTELRRWYGHDPDRWLEFKKRYFAELDAHPEAVDALLERTAAGKVTLLFGSREERLNNAHALKQYLEELGARPPAGH